MSSCILSSQGAVLATTMVISGTLILLSLFRDNKNIPPEEELRSRKNRDYSVPHVRSCLSSSGTTANGGIKKKEKKVKFADNVKKGDSKGRKIKERNTVILVENQNQIEEGRMPANRVALYQGILRDRLHRMGCTTY